jgi:hypothetical protein
MGPAVEGVIDLTADATGCAMLNEKIPKIVP